MSDTTPSDGVPMIEVPFSRGLLICKETAGGVIARLFPIKAGCPAVRRAAFRTAGNVDGHTAPDLRHVASM
ncbi:hypothetical protein [Streptomyces sp. CB02923]|uniref:hypothetical protein n=1 Tax=Streptomyces sp. CB02923 TaxID=1718985 RepID=UPI001901D70A|nr:hypothetical protein [Streptomyces sp. CB02923]